MLEFAIRDDLDKQAPRAMCVLAPLKVTITNFDASALEHFTAQLHPQKPEMGTRELPFTRELYIDRNDFRETAEKDSNGSCWVRKRDCATRTSFAPTRSFATPPGRSSSSSAPTTRTRAARTRATAAK